MDSLLDSPEEMQHCWQFYFSLVKIISDFWPLELWESKVKSETKRVENSEAKDFPEWKKSEEKGLEPWKNLAYLRNLSQTC